MTATVAISDDPSTGDTGEASTGGANTDSRAPRSTLPDGRQRFLAQVVEHSLRIGRRSAKDFVRHFPPAAIMAGLADQPQLRANILVPTTGTNEKIALKKSALGAGEDLQIALEEGVTKEGDIVALFDPDDRVRFLDHQKLWGFVVEGEFWSSARGKDLETAKEHVAFMIDCARANKLITEQDIVDGCTVDEIVERLPKAELCKLLKGALDSGRRGKPFKDDRFLEIATPAALLEYVPLHHLWSSLIVPKIAEAQRYVAGPIPSAPEHSPPETEQAENLGSGWPDENAEGLGTVVEMGDDSVPPPPLSSNPAPDEAPRARATASAQERPARGLRPAPKPPGTKATRSKRLGSIDLNEFGDDADIDGELAKLFEEEDEPTSRTNLNKIKI